MNIVMNDFHRDSCCLQSPDLLRKSTGKIMQVVSRGPVKQLEEQGSSSHQ